MKLIFQALVGIVFLALAIIQFIRPNTVNPPIVESQKIENHTVVSEEVNEILKRSCNDCHSNETVYPWYYQIQPIGWYIEDHIKEGRHELNFSEWGSYSERKKKRKLKEICEQVESGEMPLPSYLLVHRNAKLSETDVKILCDWTATELAKFPEEREEK